MGKPSLFARNRRSESLNAAYKVNNAYKCVCVESMNSHCSVLYWCSPSQNYTGMRAWQEITDFRLSRIFITQVLVCLRSSHNPVLLRQEKKYGSRQEKSCAKLTGIFMLTRRHHILSDCKPGEMRIRTGTHAHRISRPNCVQYQ